MEKTFEFVVDYQERVLPNGLTVIAAQRPQAQWQELLICVRSGAKDDPVGLEGLAHFLEHQIMCEADLTCFEFEDFFINQGGNAKSGATGMLLTYWRFMLPKEVFATGVDLLARFLFAPRWDHSALFSQEREAVLREYHEKKSSFPQAELLRLYQVLFPNRLALRHLRGPIGTLTGINSVTLADLAKFHQQHYQPSNLVLFAEGGFSADDLVEILGKSQFGAGNEPAWQNPLVELSTEPYPPKFRRVEYRLSDWGYPESGQTEVTLRGTVPAKRSPVNELLQMAIGDQAFRILRTERNLVYSTQQSFMSDFPQSNQFKFVAVLDKGIDPEVVPQAWHECLKWVESKEFEDFVQKKRANFLSKSRFPDYYQWNYPGLLELAEAYIESVPLSVLSQAATIARWEALTLEDCRAYITYLKEYVMVIGHR